MNATKLAHFTGHKAAIYALAGAVHENHFYSGGADGYVIEWALDKPDGKVIINAARPVYSLLVLRQSHQLLCGTAGGNLHLLQLSTPSNPGAELRNIEAHADGLFDMAVIGDKLLTAGGDGLIKIWDLASLTLLKTIDGPGKSARVIAVSPDQKHFAVGYSDHMIRVFSSAAFEQECLLQGHTNSVFALAWSPAGDRLASGGRDAMLKTWDVNEGYALVCDLPAHTKQIKALSYNEAGNLLVSTSMDKTIKVWDAGSASLLKVIDLERNNSHTNCINRVTRVDHERFLTCSDDKSIILWKIA